jgi:CRP/FNR family cyclic AMP-dependent transcriptional regulator
MKIDPAIAQIFAENVRAEVIQRPAPIKLDAAIVQKISQKVPVFSGMSHDCLMSTLGVGDYFAVRMGEPVFNEGDIGGSFYVVITGEVAVEKLRNGKLALLASLSAGECFGEMALVGRHVRSATVRAVRDTVTMRFEREQIDANPQSAHIIYRNIARILSARLDESSVMLADLVVQKKN